MVGMYTQQKLFYNMNRKKKTCAHKHNTLFKTNGKVDFNTCTYTEYALFFDIPI